MRFRGQLLSARKQNGSKRRHIGARVTFFFFDVPIFSADILKPAAENAQRAENPHAAALIGGASWGVQRGSPEG